MTNKFRRRIATDHDRAVCVRAAEKAPLGYVCEIREPTRSDDQNSLLWPLLEDIAGQMKWAGATRTPYQWKDLLVAAYRAEECEIVPTLDYKSVMPLGLSTSSMGVKDFSDFLEKIYQFGAENAIVFRTDERPK